MDEFSPSRSLWSTEKLVGRVSAWKRFPNKGDAMCGVEVCLGCRTEQNGVVPTELSLRRAEMVHRRSEAKQLRGRG